MGKTTAPATHLASHRRHRHSRLLLRPLERTGNLYQYRRSVQNYRVARRVSFAKWALVRSRHERVVFVYAGKWKRVGVDVSGVHGRVRADCMRVMSGMKAAGYIFSERVEPVLGTMWAMERSRWPVGLLCT